MFETDLIFYVLCTSVFVTVVIYTFIKELIKDLFFDCTKLTFEPISSNPSYRYNVEGKFFEYNPDYQDDDGSPFRQELTIQRIKKGLTNDRSRQN